MQFLFTNSASNSRIDRPNIAETLRNSFKTGTSLRDSSNIIYRKSFSNETFDEVTKLGGSLFGGPLRALSNTVSKDFKQLRLFAMVLLQSEDTVGIAKDILNEYGKWFLLYNCIISYVCTDQTQMSVFPQSQSGILYDTLLYR